MQLIGAYVAAWRFLLAPLALDPSSPKTTVAILVDDDENADPAVTPEAPMTHFVTAALGEAAAGPGALLSRLLSRWRGVFGPERISRRRIDASSRFAPAPRPPGPHGANSTALLDAALAASGKADAWLPVPAISPVGWATVRDQLLPALFLTADPDAPAEQRTDEERRYGIAAAFFEEARTRFCAAVGLGGAIGGVPCNG